MGLRSYLTIFRILWIVVDKNQCFTVKKSMNPKKKLEDVSLNNQQLCKGRDWANSL